MSERDIREEDKERRHVKVTAKVIGGLNAVPQLDALLIQVTAARFPSIGSHGRDDPPPPVSSLPWIPIAYDTIGGHRVYRVSSPIYRVDELTEEFCVQAFPKEASDLLRDDSRGVLRVGQGDQKSFRLKRNNMIVSTVVWFASLTDKPNRLRKELKAITHIGSQRKRGKGRVVEWTVEPFEHDYSWYAPHLRGTVLMRNLPECDELPDDLCGCLNEYEAVTPPYWHPKRKIDAVVPC